MSSLVFANLQLGTIFSCSSQIILQASNPLVSLTSTDQLQGNVLCCAQKDRIEDVGELTHVLSHAPDRVHLLLRLTHSNVEPVVNPKRYEHILNLKRQVSISTILCRMILASRGISQQVTFVVLESRFRLIKSVVLSNSAVGVVVRCPSGSSSCS